MKIIKTVNIFISLKKQSFNEIETFSAITILKGELNKFFQFFLQFITYTSKIKTKQENEKFVEFPFNESVFAALR